MECDVLMGHEPGWQAKLQPPGGSSWKEVGSRGTWLGHTS